MSLTSTIYEGTWKHDINGKVIVDQMFVKPMFELQFEQYWLMTLNIDPLFLERKLKMKKNVRISRGKSNSIGKYSYNVVEKGVYA